MSNEHGQVVERVIGDTLYSLNMGCWILFALLALLVPLAAWKIYDIVLYCFGGR